MMEANHKHNLEQPLNLESLLKEIIGLKELIGRSKPTEYITVSETLDILKVNRGTLRRWTKNGKLKSYSMGVRVYYIRAEIDDAMIEIQ